MKLWGHRLGYQLAWSATVMGAARGPWWPAVIAASPLGAWQLGWVQAIPLLMSLITRWSPVTADVQRWLGGAR